VYFQWVEKQKDLRPPSAWVGGCLKRPTSSGGKGTRAFIAKVQKNPSRGCETDTSMSLPVKCSTVESEFFFLNDMPTWTVFAKHPFYSLI
jgi:hypothetical protein